jgi:hypothetical protein
MHPVLSQRKYQVGLRWAAEVGRTFGLWILIAFAALQAVQIGLRLATPFDGDFGLYFYWITPLFLTAVAWVYLSKSFTSAISTGMTRKEFTGAFAVFAVIVIAGGIAFTQLIAFAYNLAHADGTDDLDVYGFSLVESLTNAAVYFSAGAAAGALLVRFGRRALGGLLAGLLISVLLLRQVPLELAQSGFFGDNERAVLEFSPGSDLHAPIDAALTCLFMLIAWAALARAPLPHKRA